MRIGISTSVVQRGRTGIAQYVFSLIRAFLEHGRPHHFTLFVLEEDLPLFGFANGMEIVPVEERYRAPVPNILWHQRVLPRLARRRCLDVLHVPSYRRMLWPEPCTRVATIHDLAPFSVPEKYDWKRMLYGRVVAKRLARRQDSIIAVSHSTARDIERFFGIPPARITTIYNGLDHARFCPEESNEAKVWAAERYDLRQPFFLYVARLEHPGKNHVRLIEAFNRLKAAARSPWQLVFGGSNWHGSEAIHAAIERSPFDRDIRCLGFIPEAQLANLYRAADVFVYPSLHEGFGLPPLEAMACGCPVVCSASGSLGEVVEDAAVTVRPESIEDLQEKLAQIASDGTLRQRLRAAGLSRARRFDWNTTAIRTLEVYDQAARAAGTLKGSCA